MKRFFSGIGSFLHMVWLWFAVLVVILPASAFANAETGGVYKLETDSSTATCVGIETPGEKHLHFLTIAHAVDGENPRVNVHGQTVSCEIVSRWKAHPEAIVLLKSRDQYSGPFKVYPLAKEPTDVAETVWVVGFPQGQYFATKTRVVDVQKLHDSYYVTNGISWHGTSGGAMLNAKGEAVAIVSTINRKEETTTCVNILAATRQFENTEQVQWRCTPQGCFPSTQQQPMQSGFRVIERGGAGILGQRYERSVESTLPLVAVTPIPVLSEFDYEKLAEILVTKYGDVLKGPAGAAGREGVPGRSVKKEEIESTITAWLDSNRDSLRGDAGPPGRDGATGKQGESFSREDLGVAVAAWLEANRLDLRAPPPTDSQVTKATAEILFADPERFRGPPGKDGSAGSAGPKGDRYVAVPDDEAFREHVERWLTANPQYKELPDLSKRIAEVESVLAKKQPVQILNPDGSVFSEDTERGILDPIVIRLEEPK